jgi:hypothetical protein
MEIKKFFMEGDPAFFKNLELPSGRGYIPESSPNPTPRSHDTTMEAG